MCAIGLVDKSAMVQVGKMKSSIFFIKSNNVKNVELSIEGMQSELWPHIERITLIMTDQKLACPSGLSMARTWDLLQG